MGVRGGHRRAIWNPDRLEKFPEPETTDDVLKAISKVIVQVHQGLLNPRVANSVVYASAGYFRGKELEGLKEVRAEIAAFKKALGVKP
jgi:hypothetical protein